MLKHGINTYKSDTSFTGTQTAESGIPYFIGAWPCHTAKGYTGVPQLALNFAEAQELGGYSNEWRDAGGAPKWSLCQAMYSHFRLYGMSPAVFCNVFDPAKHKTAVSDETVAVVSFVAVLPFEAINDDSLIVKTGADGEALVKDKDYEVYYTDNDCRIELLEDGAGYSAVSLVVSYNKADTSAITAEEIEAAIESVEMCLSTVGIVPDLLCAPGWSSNPTVAAVMAAKAPSINGLFRAKAVVDLDTSAKGADEYSKVLEYKNANGYTSEDMIVCWPLVRNGDYIFDMSVAVCGLIAKVDTGNDGCPYESPSNKELAITGTLTAGGAEIALSLPQADVISVTDGVVTAINNGGWVLWGNYTGCWPKSSDVAKYFICTNRTQDWICNTFVKTFWSSVDKPLTPVLRDAIIISFNLWLNGLTAEGKLYGGEIVYIADNNSASELVNGKFRLDTSSASPVPAQQIDMHAEYSVDMLVSAMNG